eukprot:gene7173-2991_t
MDLPDSLSAADVSMPPELAEEIGSIQASGGEEGIRGMVAQLSRRAQDMQSRALE